MEQFIIRLARLDPAEQQADLEPQVATVGSTGTAPRNQALTQRRGLQPQAFLQKVEQSPLEHFLPLAVLAGLQLLDLVLSCIREARGAHRAILRWLTQDPVAAAALRPRSGEMGTPLEVEALRRPHLAGLELVLVGLLLQVLEAPVLACCNQREDSQLLDFLQLLVSLEVAAVVEQLMELLAVMVEMEPNISFLPGP